MTTINLIKVVTYHAPGDIQCSCGNASTFNPKRNPSHNQGFGTVDAYGRNDSDGDFIRCWNCGLVAIPIPYNTPDALFPIDSPRTWSVTTPLG